MESETNRFVHERIMLSQLQQGVGVSCSMRLDLDEMSRLLNNEQIKAVMIGIAQVVAATRKDPPPSAVLP